MTILRGKVNAVCAIIVMQCAVATTLQVRCATLKHQPTSALQLIGPCQALYSLA